MAKVLLFAAYLQREVEVEVDRKAVQSRCCASGRVCSSVPHYQRERVRLCYSVIIHPLKHLGGSPSLLGPVILL